MSQYIAYSPVRAMARGKVYTASYFYVGPEVPPRSYRLGSPGAEQLPELSAQLPVLGYYQINQLVVGSADFTEITENLFKTVKPPLFSERLKRTDSERNFRNYFQN